MDECIVSKEQFEEFVYLATSGVYNMVSSQVRHLIGLDKEQHQFILKNYEELEKLYGGKHDSTL